MVKKLNRGMKDIKTMKIKLLEVKATCKIKMQQMGLAAYQILQNKRLVNLKTEQQKFYKMKHGEKKKIKKNNTASPRFWTTPNSLICM